MPTTFKLVDRQLKGVAIEERYKFTRDGSTASAFVIGEDVPKIKLEKADGSVYIIERGDSNAQLTTFSWASGKTTITLSNTGQAVSTTCYVTVYIGPELGRQLP